MSLETKSEVTTLTTDFLIDAIFEVAKDAAEFIGRPRSRELRTFAAYLKRIPLNSLENVELWRQGCRLLIVHLRKELDERQIQTKADT